MRTLLRFARIFRGGAFGVAAAWLIIAAPTVGRAQTASADEVRESIAGLQMWQSKIATTGYQASWTNKPRPGVRSAAQISVIVERTPRATALTLGAGSSARVILIDDAYTTNLSVGSSKRVVNPREMGLGQLAQYDPLSLFFLLPADMKNPGSKTVTLVDAVRAAGDGVTWTRTDATGTIQFRAATADWSATMEPAPNAAGVRVVEFNLPPADARSLARVFEFTYGETSTLPVSMRETARASDGETRVLREAKITTLAAKPFGEYPGPFRYTAEPGQVIDDYTGEAASNRAPARTPGVR
jgi:hypothetical protein